ncbi:predicted protein, partial [Nematostella vectensis]
MADQSPVVACVVYSRWGLIIGIQDGGQQRSGQNGTQFLAHNSTFSLLTMALLQWRRLNFFDKEVLKDPQTNQTYSRLQDIDIAACSSGRGQMVFGDTNGSIHFVDSELNLTSFKAFEIRVSHLYQLKQHNILVSIGEDEAGINPLVRVWNLDKPDKLGNPVCCQMLRAIPGNKPVAVSCLAVLENLTQMAVGFADGSVVVYKGDITRDRHSKQRLIHQDKHPITGLGYRQTGASTILFVVTQETLLSYNLSSKDHRALYFYQPDGRGPCLAFEAFTGTFPGVIEVLSEWGNLYVLTMDKKIFQLEEKPTQTKLEILFKKNLYALAISKGDHDGAIQEYIKTIGHLEPSYVIRKVSHLDLSYVIRKFLDAQRIHNLTAYLQALHEHGLANTDHTTLLLNCYTKLKDVSKLDEFIMSEKELNFDVETAIKVCRQAGYFKHAVNLANKFEQHDWYLKIQLEDLHDYQKALEYIAQLDFYE